jgi:immune inhibitor A
MTRTLPRYLLGLVLALGCLWPLLAADPIQPVKAESPSLLPDLSEYKTVDTAVTTTIKRGGTAAQSLPGFLGVLVEITPQGNLMAVAIAADSPAAKAGLQQNDLLLKIGDKELADTDAFREVLLSHKADEEVKLTIVRKNKLQEITAKLGAPSRPLRAEESAPMGRRGWDTRTNTWKKEGYKLALICIEYPDAKHNAKIATKDWEESLFSRGAYKNKNNATAQPVHGSMNDFYHELSCDTLNIEGKVFDWVEVKKNRMDYAPANGGGERTALFTEAMDKILARDGKDALKEFDGVFFLYAGERARVSRGNLYWPHRASFRHNGKSWPYFICGEGGSRMEDISVFCHEFGHMLGLPDLYARPENPGSEGLGVWCCMSNQVGRGKPQHFCAWSKEQLGWVKPAVLDPAVKQKLILAPVEGNTKECFKVLVRLDGSEYFLLENRRKKGFDESLPAEGLLIWRVVNNRPLLEESHGVEGPAGPNVFRDLVPYPSTANDAFTPYTTPSSRAQLGGGLPVHITNIRRLPDGRITFYIGYEYD